MEQVEQVKVAVLEEQMKTLGKGMDALGSKIDSLTDKIDNNYVKKEDFKPVKDSVEGLRFWQAKMSAYATIIAVLVELALRWFLKTP